MPGEHCSLHPERDVTDVHLRRGDIRLDAASHETAPEDGSLISTGSSISARHTTTANNNNNKGQTDGYQIVCYRTSYVRTVPTSGLLH
jgi:hypothetical protein